MGCPPEAEESLKVYIDEVKAELVDEEYDFGWQLQDRIAYSHSGYFCDAKKIAIIQGIKNEEFFV